MVVYTWIMIESIVAEVFGSVRVLRSWPLTGGIVAETTAVEMEAGDGRLRTVVVRQPSSQAEFGCFELAHRLGLQTPEPFGLVESEAGAALVMEFVEGKMDFGTGDVASYIRQMAEQLAAIHSLSLAGEEVWFLAERPFACQEVSRLPEPKMDPGFDVGRVVRVLGERLFSRKNGFALLHGDYWAGNMLWQAGKLAAVIDWEDAGLGDPLKDLAEARVEVVWLFGVAAAAQFLADYQAKAAIDYGDLPLWDLCAVLRLWRLTGGDWGWLENWVRDQGREDITADLIRERYGRFVSDTLGILT